ncbi:mRNA turnover protein 4 homolog [Corticium candelabrum]|uniref:mRNA turnover protein 4 homolog n=1 Tax=Corticium candelabrum TaxID=121492 RepID=UPI002E276AF4|nr:mRNA turnover protein 4 homolog [Corticium candelabrum]
MPKSKRAKQISLTRTKRKGLESKKGLVHEIQECCDNYANIFIFNVENMRNSKLKEVRTEWRHSRFFFGKNKVMALALGKTPEQEYKDNLHLVSQRLKGSVGLLFTNQSREYVTNWFDKYREMDYARSGSTSTLTVVLDAGPLEEFSHAIEPQLRQLGLPTTLKKGVITLLEDYQVCSLGDTLTPEQAKILKLLGHPMVEFRIQLEYAWSNGEGTELTS